MEVGQAVYLGVEAIFLSNSAHKPVHERGEELMRSIKTIQLVFTGLLAAVLMSGLAVAEEIKSGLQEGDFVPAFHVTKAGGAQDDGKSEGWTGCYRCYLGNKPVVMVFARSTDENLAKLVKQIDETVAANSDKKMASFVNIIGKDADKAATSAKAFAKKHGFKNVAICVAKDLPNGPEGFAIAPQADVTVMTYVNGQVKDNKTFGKGQVDGKGIAAVVAGTKKILNN